jgi:hypothetical protein
MRGLIRRSVIFSENIYYDHHPLFASAAPPAMVEFGHFGILTDGRPIRFGGCNLSRAALELVKQSGVGSLRAAEFFLGPPAGRVAERGQFFHTLLPESRVCRGVSQSPCHWYAFGG